MIKVSVVVPVYNVEKYLERCLETLVNQTLEELEIIIVNDGSTDDSLKIIEKYVLEYPGKIHAFCKENGGLSDARNYGMRFCKGEYVGFIDADDYVEKEMFEELYKKAKDEKCDVVICDYIKEYISAQEVVKVCQYSSPKSMFIGGLAAAWNKIYRRELVEKAGLQFPKGLIYEDTEFFCCLIPHIRRCGYVGMPFVHYVQRRDSIANSQGDKIAMIFSVFDNIISYYKRKEWYKEYSQEIEYFSVRVLFGSSMERICRCKDAGLRKKLLYQTWDYSQERFPGWKRNGYLRDLSDTRNLYMKVINRYNIVLLGTVLRRYFILKEKKLFR